MTFSLISTVSAQAQTIGDIARQERERQRAVQSTATLTNTPTISTSESIIENAGPTKVPASPSVVEEKPNELVKSALEDAKANLKAAEDQVVSLQLSLAQARLESIRKRNNAAQAAIRSKSIDQQTRSLKAAEKKVALQREKLMQIEADLRRHDKTPR